MLVYNILYTNILVYLVWCWICLDTLCLWFWNSRMDQLADCFASMCLWTPFIWFSLWHSRLSLRAFTVCVDYWKGTLFGNVSLWVWNCQGSVSGRSVGGTQRSSSLIAQFSCFNMFESQNSFYCSLIFQLLSCPGWRSRRQRLGVPRFGVGFGG